MWPHRYDLYDIRDTSSENDCKHAQYTLRINTSKNENEIRLSRMWCINLQRLFKADLRGISFIIMYSISQTKAITCLEAALPCFVLPSHTVSGLCVTFMCHYLQIITSIIFNAHTHLQSILLVHYATQLQSVFLTKVYIMIFDYKGQNKTCQDKAKRHVPSYKNTRKGCTLVLKRCIWMYSKWWAQRISYRLCICNESRGTNGYGIHV